MKRNGLIAVNIKYPDKWLNNKDTIEGIIKRALKNNDIEITLLAVEVSEN